MITLFALLFLAAGLAILVNAIVQARSRVQEFPRYRAPVTAGRQFLPILLGIIITVCGAGMLFVARTK